MNHTIHIVARTPPETRTARVGKMRKKKMMTARRMLVDPAP
jgi:hypothetical protein